MSNFEKMYKETVRGLHKYNSPKLTVEQFMKQLDLEENYDKLDSLEKAHKVNSYVADTTGDEYYYNGEEEWRDEYTLHTKKPADFRGCNALLPPKFNVKAILGMDKLNIMD